MSLTTTALAESENPEISETYLWTKYYEAIETYISAWYLLFSYLQFFTFDCLVSYNQQLTNLARRSSTTVESSGIID